MGGVGKTMVGHHPIKVYQIIISMYNIHRVDGKAAILSFNPFLELAIGDCSVIRPDKAHVLAGRHSKCPL